MIQYRFTDPQHGDIALTRKLIAGILAQADQSNQFYVNSETGNDNNSGVVDDEAFKSINQGVARVNPGGIIRITGSFNEAVICAKAGVTFMNEGPTSNRALWTAPDTAAPCLTVAAAPDVKVQNIRLRPPVANVAIALTGASHQFTMEGSRIQGKLNSKGGLHTDGAQANVALLGNEFFYINKASTDGHAILGETYDAEPTGWYLEGNVFQSNTYHLILRLNRSTIIRNVFSGKGLTAANTGAAPSKCIDISGGTVAAPGCNIVTQNALGGAYDTGLYVAGADDNWVGNYAASNATTCVNGITLAVPAAP